jgi:hypothetical protein
VLSDLACGAAGIPEPSFVLFHCAFVVFWLTLPSALSTLNWKDALKQSEVGEQEDMEILLTNVFGGIAHQIIGSRVINSAGQDFLVASYRL